MLEDKELLQICYPVTEENWKDNSIYDGVVSHAQIYTQEKKNLMESELCLEIKVTFKRYSTQHLQTMLEADSMCPTQPIFPSVFKQMAHSLGEHQMKYLACI